MTQQKARHLCWGGEVLRHHSEDPRLETALLWLLIAHQLGCLGVRQNFRIPPVAVGGRLVSRALVLIRLTCFVFISPSLPPPSLTHCPFEKVKEPLGVGAVQNGRL